MKYLLTGYVDRWDARYQVEYTRDVRSRIKEYMQNNTWMEELEIRLLAHIVSWTEIYL